MGRYPISGLRGLGGLSVEPARFTIQVLYLAVATTKPNPPKGGGRKATGPRFLREAMEDLPKDPKIAGPPGTISPRDRTPC